MKISTDANVLLRIVLDDDPAQAVAAREVLSQASLIAIPIAALCEFVWVAGAGYRLGRQAIIEALEALLATKGASYDEGAAHAGLNMLRAGGDFADGVIAYDGHRLGGEVFMTFDRKAARKVAATGIQTRLPVTGH